jgi:hypothetical protein
MNTWPAVLTNTACRLDTCGCCNTMSLSGVRPIVWNGFWKSRLPITVWFFFCPPDDGPGAFCTDWDTIAGCAGA